MNKIHTFLIIFLFLNSINAQTFTGNVRDAVSSKNLQNVLIEITDKDSGTKDTLVTDFYGNWSYTLTSIENTQPPNTFNVNQNYPNPFNPSTNITFSIFESEKVNIVIHDILGRVVDKKEFSLQSGSYKIKYDGKGSAGIYFYTISTSQYSITKKMLQLDGLNGKGLTDLRSTNYKSSFMLAKPNAKNIRIVFSKFAYVNDTLNETVNGGENFENTLESLHSNAILVDLHNDILERIFMEDPNYHLYILHSKFETDVPRLKQGGVDLQFFAAWVSPTAYIGKYYQTTLDLIERLNYETFLNLNEIALTTNYESSLNEINQNKIAAVIGVEGGHSIESSIDKLVQLYNMGMRYLTITWNNSTEWAVSASDSRTNTVGLSEFGKDVIRKMDSLGIIIDVSHTGIKTISDILEITQNPIMATHSGVRAIKNSSRNLYDSQIKDIANSGGVIGVVFYPPFIGDADSDGDSDIADVIAHIDYIVNLVGIDYIAIGSDFDGTNGNLVKGLSDVTKYPDLTIALLEHGYTHSDIRKILGENFLRVFKQVCK
ncbi:MAG: membrane dipeptidase [Bacteroidetes bacterium]|nr:membrane dipeptidase [Bacteroidota bacterium]MBU1117255.1 membrane dipeptidase [Bacteroidota bacterium]MBU1797404.1 membrane dipeptidase [Bacteroidota bacterium]